MSNFDLVLNKCKKDLNLGNAILSDEYYYTSLVFCLIDSIFSIGVRYSGTKNVVIRYWMYVCSKYKQNFTRTDRLNRCSNSLKISQLKKEIESVGSPQKFACDVLKNQCRLSPRAKDKGILKADAVYKACCIFEKNNIETLEDFNTNGYKIEEAFCSIRGLESGIAFDYLKMLAGDDFSIKYDRMLKRFVEEAVGKEISKTEGNSLLLSACNELRKYYPNLTPRLLDHTIWNYQRKK